MNEILRGSSGIFLCPIGTTEVVPSRAFHSITSLSIARSGNPHFWQHRPEVGHPLFHSIGLQTARFADYVFDLRKIMMFLRRGERDGGVEASDADDGAIEIVESFFVDDGGYFSGEAS